MTPVRFLEGQQVYLRPIEIADTDWYLASLYQPNTRKLTGTQKHFNREQILRYIEGKSQDASTVLLLIALRDSDELIGDIAIQSIDPVNRNANIRIAISSEEHQNKGYGTEALRLMLDYGFGVLHLHRIELNVFSYNERAARVYENIGFKREGVQREVLFYDHQFHDAIIMSILEDEYRASRGHC
ncbi:GNAT family N-acetyltransferase [Paenibacillus turpanensis]|uniref:GNAT family N-acetyltransferase n=1 Tax=Paenibacillus turpanensis TaxID=2689078 RepID=UPI001408F866|nr:GNAT family protein [Paenibacillus turpanensis]